jgi:thioredoxin-dependent peroxiredoxin
MASGPRVGDPAPDFELDGTRGRFRLSDQRGRRVVLLFYPGGITPICTRQFCSYRDRAEELGALDAVIVGISHGDLAAQERFTARHGLTVPLLSDAGRAVARRFGVAVPVLGTRRATFVLDEEGVVRVRRVHAVGLDFEDADDLREALAAVPAAS